MMAASRARDLRIIEDLFAAIPSLPQRHATSDAVWRLWNVTALDCIARLFSSVTPDPIQFGPFGVLIFPFVEMGAIDSRNLFGLDELILFSFYFTNRKRYRHAVDFGANIGLHSIMMARSGFETRSFEPDPTHFQILGRNLAANQVKADLHEAAVSLNSGEMEFVRVLGNTTGSHLSGAKPAPYGELRRFPVKVEAAAAHLAWADLAKIDIEGHEAALITGLPASLWSSTDAVVEIGTAENAALVFDHLQGSEINLFAQKIGWDKVTTVSEMPTSHRDGSLFISAKSSMPWE